MIDTQNPLTVLYVGLVLIAVVLALSLATGKWLSRSEPQQSRVSLGWRGWRFLLLLTLAVCLGAFLVQQGYIAFTQTRVG